MIITCEECSTSFNLDEKLLKPSGSKVRCSKCKHVFTAFPAVVPVETEAPPAEAPVDAPESDAGVATAPGMVPGVDSEAAEEDAQEEEGGGDDQPEDLDFGLDGSGETGGEADADELDLTGMGATLEMGAPPPGELAAETEDVTDDLDLDFDMGAEPEAGKEAEEEELDLSSLDEALGLDDEPAGEDAAGAEAETDDLVLDFDMGAEPEAGKEAEEEELDLSSLDEALGLDAEPAGEDAVETPAVPGEDLLKDLDLDLDMGAEPEAGKEAEDGELDLSSLDEALDLDAEPAAEAAVGTPAATGEDLLEDLDLDLDMDVEPEAAQEADADELDMSDIKFELGDEEDDKTPAEDSDLEFDLEMEPSVGETGEEKEDPGMAGFEETLEMDSPPDLYAGGEVEELDLELELEMGGDSNTGSEPEAADAAAKDAEEEIEDLDFELDMEFETDDNLEGAELELESDGTEDLDMSDIEQMLEVKDGDISGGDIAVAGLDDLSEPEVEKWKDTPGEKAPGDDTAEIDLSDIDLDVEGAEDVEIEDQELDLDLDEETIKSAEAIASGKRPLPEEPEELDISQFEDLELEEKAAAGVLNEGDIELEFEVDGGSTDGISGEAASDVADPTQQLETIAMDGPPDISQKAAVKAAEKPKAKKAKKEKKKKVKKTKPVGKSSSATPALAILLLLLIAFGAVVVLDRYVGIEIPYVTQYVKQIPYVNQLMNQDAKKTGEITTSNINSRFVDNENSGRLFVITGMVKNEFPESRRFIQLTGRLFAGGKALVKEETIYCGNSLTDIQLAQMDLVEIDKRLANRFGDNRSNVNVEPGQQLPFLVVFSDFPQDLEEFTIEVVSSSPVQP